MEADRFTNYFLNPFTEAIQKGVKESSENNLEKLKNK